MDDDTDTLIALVASLLPSHHNSTDSDSILRALVEANGDPNTAARILLRPNYSTTSDKKRRRPIDLETWLNPKSKQKTKNLKPISGAPSDAIPPSPKSIKLAESIPSGSTAKPPVNLMSVLRQPTPSSSKVGPPRLPPMILTTPDMVAQHTPCTLHLSVLPPELACRLFYTMIDASKTWKRNKWWLFDRVVESPHLTSFFARRTNGLDDDEKWQEAAQYWYNGRMTDSPLSFPPAMEDACRIVEEVVNAEIRKRPKTFKSMWRGLADEDPLWRANVAASNCYQGGKESVGFHSDQLTYLGPYPTIASLSLGTRRNFSLREVVTTNESEVRRAQTFNIPLPHNSLTIMHASCQEKFKHSIPPQSAVDLFRPAYPPESGTREGVVIEPSNCRINITFRFYRPDFSPKSIPRCSCGIPTILRPDMKNRNDEETDRYWWTCYAGAQNDGKGCNFWKIMDMRQEGRGEAYAGGKRKNGPEHESPTLCL